MVLLSLISQGLALLTLSWDKNWDSHSLLNGYPSFYPRIALVAPSPGETPNLVAFFMNLFFGVLIKLIVLLESISYENMGLVFSNASDMRYDNCQYCYQNWYSAVATCFQFFFFFLQSGTKPNLVAKIWLPTLVTICNGLPKLVAKIISHIHHLVNTGLHVGSLVKWLPIKVAIPAN